jgi:serine/threonine protein kinase
VKILLEYVNGGTLGQLIRKQISLSEEQIKLIAAQLLLAVDFMERKKIIHRDLKPENILVHLSEEIELYTPQIQSIKLPQSEDEP